VDDRLSRLFQVAYRTVPALEANQAIAQAREEAAASGAAAARPLRDDESSAPMSRSYELVVNPGASWEEFAAEALPRLIYHLESVGAQPPACKGVVVAAFVGDRLHFLRASDLLRFTAELTGVPADELFRRHGTGEKRTAVRGPPPALPPGGKKN
jgi:hypothetical protein